LKVSREIRGEMDAALRVYLEYYLERKLKSRRILEDILQPARGE
jgi:hypothetical protein